jgi:hypothetical protein
MFIGSAKLKFDEFLAERAAIIHPVDVHFQWRPQVRDPQEEMLLEAGING